MYPFTGDLSEGILTSTPPLSRPRRVGPWPRRKDCFIFTMKSAASIPSYSADSEVGSFFARPSIVVEPGLS